MNPDACVVDQNGLPVPLLEFVGLENLNKHTDEMLRVRNIMLSLRSNRAEPGVELTKEYYGLYRLPISAISEIAKYNSGCRYFRGVDEIINLGGCISTSAKDICFVKHPDLVNERIAHLTKVSNSLITTKIKLVLCGGAVLCSMLGLKIKDYDFFPVMSPSKMLDKGLLQGGTINEESFGEHVKRGFKHVVRKADKISQHLGLTLSNHNNSVFSVDIIMVGYDQDESKRVKMVLQLVKRTHYTISEIIHGFDIPACQFAIYNGKIYCTGAALSALVNRTISCHVSASSSNYTDRLLKYHERGFHILPHGLVRYEPPDMTIVRRQHKMCMKIACGIMWPDPDDELLNKYKVLDVASLGEIKQMIKNYFGEDVEIDDIDKSYMSLVASMVSRCIKSFERISCYDAIWISSNHYHMTSSDQAYEPIYYDICNLVTRGARPVPQFMFYGCLRDDPLPGHVNYYERDQQGWVGDRGVVVQKMKPSKK